MVYYACKLTFFQIEFSVDCSILLLKDLFFVSTHILLLFPLVAAKSHFHMDPSHALKVIITNDPVEPPKKCKTRKLPIFYLVNSL